MQKEEKEQSAQMMKALKDFKSLKTGHAVVKTQIFTKNPNSPDAFDTLSIDATLMAKEPSLKTAVNAIVSYANRVAVSKLNSLTDLNGRNENRVHMNRFNKEMAEAKNKAVAEA